MEASLQNCGVVDSKKYSKYNWNYQKSDSTNISRLIRESPQCFRLLDGDFIMTIDFRHSHFHQNLEFSENQRHAARLILYPNWSSIPILNHMYVHWLLNELRSDSYKYILKSGQRTNNFKHELYRTGEKAEYYPIVCYYHSKSGLKLNHYYKTHQQFCFRGASTCQRSEVVISYSGICVFELSTAPTFLHRKKSKLACQRMDYSSMYI